MNGAVHIDSEKRCTRPKHKMKNLREGSTTKSIHLFLVVADIYLTNYIVNIKLGNVNLYLQSCSQDDLYFNIC